ncbi:DUF2188 domain-containing protein [Rhizobium sp. L1K21]|uniref:DUF2188 domain-containing protein n=1 Tax=Rhizobium sp. L1K21 TaxID=2954933 RepID=UPI002092685E|nr:DUF2188 domain-containing protein [Rhizobium sp. L1K21]MCO6187832.1 DUF2188 domain-containing protein [Rhizobium sp. L1K21]
MHITYHVERHDEVWAYRLDDVWSEPYATHDDAFEAARSAAERQRLEGSDTTINYQTEDGQWHYEFSAAGDRPQSDVEA